jgi:hypothetical protein
MYAVTDRELVTVSEAARLIGLSAARVRQLADAGALAGERGPYGRLISRVSAEDYARGREDRLRRAEQVRA